MCKQHAPQKEMAFTKDLTGYQMNSPRQSRYFFFTSKICTLCKNELRPLKNHLKTLNLYSVVVNWKYCVICAWLVLVYTTAQNAELVVTGKLCFKIVD